MEGSESDNEDNLLLPNYKASTAHQIPIFSKEDDDPNFRTIGTFSLTQNISYVHSSHDQLQQPLALQHRPPNPSLEDLPEGPKIPHRPTTLNHNDFKISFNYHSENQYQHHHQHKHKKLNRSQSSGNLWSPGFARSSEYAPHPADFTSIASDHDEQRKNYTPPAPDEITYKLKTKKKRHHHDSGQDQQQTPKSEPQPLPPQNDDKSGQQQPSQQIDDKSGQQQTPPQAKANASLTGAHDIMLLSGLSLGAVNWDVWAQCTPKQMYYYLPLFIRVLSRNGILPEEFYRGILVNFSNNTDKSFRQLTYWMCKCEMFPNDSKNKFNYFEEDQIETDKFFDNFQTKLLKVGEKRQFDTPCCDPIFGLLMHELEVLKLFKAHTRPALCEVTLCSLQKFRFIYKEGDDLRDDMYTQTMFYIFNKIWEYSGMTRKPFIRLYKVFPTAIDKGFVEYVPSSTLQDFRWKDELSKYDNIKKEEFICSAAGAFAGAFILGIRDRHRDNMMISEEGHFFHIDFGYMFNNKTWFDANRFAIPSEIRENLLNMWDGFLDLIAESYRMLRRHRGMISYFVTKLYGGDQKLDGIKKYKEVQIIKCLSGAFYDVLTEDEAVQHVREVASRGEASPKKAIKDLVHKFESKKKN